MFTEMRGAVEDTKPSGHFKLYISSVEYLYNFKLVLCFIPFNIRTMSKLPTLLLKMELDYLNKHFLDIFHDLPLFSQYTK